MMNGHWKDTRERMGDFRRPGMVDAEPRHINDRQFESVESRRRRASGPIKVDSRTRPPRG